MRTMNTFEKATLTTTGMASAVALMAGAAQAQDFDGFYMGVSVGMLSGDTPIGYTSDQYKLEKHGTPGMFVGYNQSMASGLVVGAELAFQGETGGDDDDGSSYDTYSIKNVIDLKAKVGTQVAAGGKPILLYGFAGMSSGNVAMYYGDYSFTGYNYGLGAEMKVSEAFSIGLELMGRNVDSYDSSDGDITTNHQQVSLRGAFHF